MAYVYAVRQMETLHSEKFDANEKDLDTFGANLQLY